MSSARCVRAASTCAQAASMPSRSATSPLRAPTYLTPRTITMTSRITIKLVFIASTRQVFAADFEAFEIAEHRQRDLLRIEEGLSDTLHVGSADLFDAFHQLIQAEKPPEVHLLAGQVRHTAGSGLQAEHEGA